VKLDELGRFSEPALLVLLSLLGGERHGYAISVDIESITGRRLGPGTLYGAIGRLEERGLIAGWGIRRWTRHQTTEAVSPHAAWP